MVDPKEMVRILRNLFNGGTIARLPRNRRHSEALLALAAASLDSQSEYDEPELNSDLADWMDGFTDPLHFDHVTVRRYLVDLSMLLRDPEGRRYRTNQPVISQFILPETRSVNPLAVYHEVQMERLDRAEQHRNQRTTGGAQRTDS